MSRLPRRDLLTLFTLGAASLVAPRSRADALDWQRLEIDAGGSSTFATRAVALIPPNLSSGRNRLLVLLHGYSAGASDTRALRFWQRDYGVERAHRRLREPPIARLYDTVRYLTDQRIRELDRTLAERAFDGMVLLCPLVPKPYFRASSGPLFEEYSNWLVERLLVQARSALPVSATSEDTGLAGMSMGGQFALEALARRPEAFGAVSAVLAAIDKRAAWTYAARIGKAIAKNDAPRLQILTATRDSYFDGNETLRVALAQKKLKPEFRAPFGPHNAGWMREVGSLELLLWMDRVLAKSIGDVPEPEAKR